MAHDERDQKARSSTTEVRAQDKPSRETGRGSLERHESGLRSWSDPFETMRRFMEQFERRPFGSMWSTWPGETARRRGLAGVWSPQIESFQRDDRFVVRADLPGLTREDVHVEIEDAAIVIRGERTSEAQHEDDGYYTSERTYGRFCRVVPLPDGAIQDSARATFENGVLEVTVQAPPRDVRRGRTIEITGGQRASS